MQPHAPALLPGVCSRLKVRWNPGTRQRAPQRPRLQHRPPWSAWFPSGRLALSWCMGGLLQKGWSALRHGVGKRSYLLCHPFLGAQTRFVQRRGTQRPLFSAIIPKGQHASVVPVSVGLRDQYGNSRLLVLPWRGRARTLWPDHHISAPQRGCTYRSIFLPPP